MTDRSPDGIYALRYAYRTESIRGEHFFGHDHDCHAPYPIDYFVWAICRGDDVVLVDTGFTEAAAAARGARIYVDRPAKLLESLGRSSRDVSRIILTHLHYDHSGTVSDFPDAIVHVQQDELDFWSGEFAKRGTFSHFFSADDLAHLRVREQGGSLVIENGDQILDEQVRLLEVGGHSAGLQIATVQSEAGLVVLAGDASHFYENFETDTPYSLVHDLPAMHAAFDRMRELAGPDGIVVPGHDPRVRERHPLLPHNENIAFIAAL